jgi:hypothetical protein
LCGIWLGRERRRKRRKGTIGEEEGENEEEEEERKSGRRIRSSLAPWFTRNLLINFHVMIPPFSMHIMNFHNKEKMPSLTSES